MFDKNTFSLLPCGFKAIYTFTKSINALFLQFFMLLHNNMYYRIPFFHPSISLIYLLRVRETLSALLILKLSYFGKNYSWKIKVLQIFGSWDQEIDSWFRYLKPLIPTLWITSHEGNTVQLYPLKSHMWGSF